jgi:hypothetical protein
MSRPARLEACSSPGQRAAIRPPRASRSRRRPGACWPPAARQAVRLE